MPNEEPIRLASGFTVDERRRLRATLDDYATRIAKDYGHPLEAVVQEIRYWQQSVSAGRTNPKAQQKKASFHFWGQVCMVCNEVIESLAAATFHHLKRGVPDLHGPTNMRPLHRDESKGCHEKLHGAPAGSLTAGSRRRQR